MGKSSCFWHAEYQANLDLVLHYLNKERLAAHPTCKVLL